jgi:hypothetical protein
MAKGYSYQPKNLNITKEVPSEKPNLDPKEKYFIWHISGGLGKNVASTSLLKDVKEKYPDRKFIVVASWPEVFLNNPNIDRVYNISALSYFYEDYIEGKDVIMCSHEPYSQTGHITKQKHLIHNWCDLLDIEYKGQQPIILANYAQNIYLSKWDRPKPIMVLQTGGGPMQNQKYPYSWTRDIPPEIAQEIVKKYSQQYHIIQISRPGGYKLENTERLDQPLSNMELFSILFKSEKRVLIDSCLQHAAAALKLKSTVLWVGTSPKVFGYEGHTNVVAKTTKRANQLISSYMFDYQFENNVHECPYTDLGQIFNINDIFNSI